MLNLRNRKYCLLPFRAVVFVYPLANALLHIFSHFSPYVNSELNLKPLKAVSEYL